MRKMEEKHLNIAKVIITAISALVLIAIITILTIFLTNKKQAVEVVVSDTEQTNLEGKNNEKIWEIKKSDNKDNNVNVSQNNSSNNNTQNQIQNTNQDTNIAQNTVETNNTNETNTVAENSVQENSIVANTTEKNNTIQNTVETANTNTNTTETKTATTDNKKSNNGVIWLTFDDGPSANITPKVLDILKKENIKATFFVINYSNSNEHLLKREVAEGHTIGIHGYSHEYSKIYKSKETFMSNVYTLQDRIYKSTGVKSMYTRFPGGSSNTVSRKYCKGIMTELTKEMLAKGFKYYDWNISSGDAGGAKDAKGVYKNVTKNLSKKRGNMVLMHDFGANKKGLEALPKIIEYAKKEGYTFAPIDDNTPMYAQHVNN